MNDSEKLRALATWFDVYDNRLQAERINQPSNEVQTDLRRIADSLDRKPPSDEEIFTWAKEKSREFHKELLARQCFIEGARWMRIKLYGE